MKKELQYALVTSSALPSEIQESEHYVDLEKEQWLDLVDYSTEVVKHDENQEILFLIVAKGTPEQQVEDDARRARKEQERSELNESVEELNQKLSSMDKESCECIEQKEDLQEKHDLLEKQLDDILGTKEQLKDELSKLKEADRLEEEREKQKAEQATSRKKSIRDKSVSIFNALYEK